MIDDAVRIELDGGADLIAAHEISRRHDAHDHIHGALLNRMNSGVILRPIDPDVLIRMVLTEPCRDIARAQLGDPRQPAFDLVMTEPCRNCSACDDLPCLIDDIPFAQIQDILAQFVCANAKRPNIRKQGLIFTGELPIERNEPLLFHHEGVVPCREALGLSTQIILLSFETRNLLLRFFEITARLFLRTLCTRKFTRGKVQCCSCLSNHSVQPIHAKERRAHILRHCRHDSERHRRDTDARKDRNDDRRMTRAQSKNGKFLFPDARAETVADKGDDTADDSEDKNKCNTVHRACHPFLFANISPVKIIAKRGAGESRPQ